MQVKVKPDAAQSYGLKPGDVRRAAATLMAGEEVGDIFTRRQALTTSCVDARRSRAQPQLPSSNC